MPCNCDHLEPTQHERESYKLMSLMTEVGIYTDEIPYYGDVKNIHKHTEMLCKFCQKTDVSNYSLELQIWWRDHQAADKKKLEDQLQKAKFEEEKKAAISKLTDYERLLLGL